MRVFLTGATGFIGRHILPELQAAGHQVLGLARSDASAEALRAAGAEVHRGTLEDTESLRRGAEAADAIVHTAFDHDFSKFAANCEKDARAIAAMGVVARDGKHPFLITSGVAFGTPGPGEVAREDVYATDHPHPRAISERAGAALATTGADVRIIRLPQVHDTQNQGLFSPFIDLARSKGFVGYMGGGRNRWSAVHVSDAARLYVQALDYGVPGGRYHAVAEEAIPMRTIADVIGKGLGLPVRVLKPEEEKLYLGWMANFAGLDMAASSARTRVHLGWQPSGPTLEADLQAMFAGA